ncbi:S-adenosyl-L-methionine-dependent methyltransferase [Jimgerdemannia flammicorona]|uniref:S-adenosyl-L-methionine-dependent methyltransferase n=1 Tax=Jimgerdemannia flammicorona TaxID=994334 RepID=A0A433Q615_9FUNG|nr:S-adenosyl-L-methionine-dependent methyltransferase [Jimgerdemannia flammicorona]
MGNNKSKDMLGNGPEEISRLENQHDILRTLVHGNYHAPMDEALERGIRVLDVGCGPGKWTLEMAQDYPASQFTGTDKAPVFPRNPPLPNCRYIQADTLKGLPFADNTFDYVFQRFLFLAFTQSDWAVVMYELIRVTKPGGWIELFEFDLKFERTGPTYDRVWSALSSACETRGIHIRVSQELPQLMSSLENVHSETLTASMGWNGRLGEQAAHNFQQALLGMRKKLAHELNISNEHYAQIVIRAVSEFPENKTWTKMPYVYGMKPLTGSRPAVARAR